MKSILMDAVFSSFSSRADGSVGFRGSGPEMSAEEKVALMELHGLNVKLLITPSDFEPECKVVVDRDLGSKTPSQRLRAILFIQWKQKSTHGDTFDEYYSRRMSDICEAEKQLLEPDM